MYKNEYEKFCTICSSFFIGMIIGSLIGTFVTGIFSERAWRDMTIERGYAQYNQTTGDWEWKE